MHQLDPTTPGPAERPTRLDTLIACLWNPELLQQFDRLRGTNLTRKGTPLELVIDETTGRRAAEIQMFMEFVDDLYKRLPQPPL